MFKVRIGLALVGLAVLLIIAAQNSDVVQLQFLNLETSISLVALVFLTAAAGFFIGLTVGKLGGARKPASK